MIENAVLNLMMELITLSFVIPVVFIAVWKMRVRESLIPVGIGLGAYLIFAEVFRSVPDFLFLVAIRPLAHQINQNIGLFTLYTALAAVLLQGLARYVVFRFFIKEEQSVNAAVSFGLGFGCMECIISLGIDNLRNYSFAQMINNQQTGELLQSVDASTAASYRKIIQDLTSLNRLELLLDGADQFLFFFLQAALAVLVYYAVHQAKQKRMIWGSMGLQGMILLLDVLPQMGIVPRGIVVLSRIILTVGIARNAYHYYKDLSAKAEKTKESGSRDGWNYANKRYVSKDSKENTDL